MKKYYVVHMKSTSLYPNGHELFFNLKATYVDTLINQNLVTIMEERGGAILGIIPIDNIEWIQTCYEYEEE